MDDDRGADRRGDEQRPGGREAASKGINPVQHSERTASKGINPVQHSEGRQGGDGQGDEKGDG